MGFKTTPDEVFLSPFSLSKVQYVVSFSVALLLNRVAFKEFFSLMMNHTMVSYKPSSQFEFCLHIQLFQPSVFHVIFSLTLSVVVCLICLQIFAPTVILSYYVDKRKFTGA